MDWTDEQLRLLVECSYHMTVVTGHALGECVVKIDELIKAYRLGKVDERGKSNDNQQA